MVGEALERAQSDEIAETVESLAPTRLGTHQPEPFPIAKTARRLLPECAQLLVGVYRCAKPAIPP